ncbi:MAG TPA: TetR/AcrR family transcriptional regulator [Marmoricola sp.]|nr:TetR/AcrR family transcriptional regulator [Marmoricola sp.]
MQHAETRARSYGGKSAEQRRAERRDALIAAASELWREQGWAAVTMRGVCARARLTDRYFYENFADRDALLGEVWDATRDEHLTMLYAAIEPHLADTALAQLHAAVEAVVRRIADDPGGAQILFGDHAGSATLERRRRETIQTAVDIFLALSRPYLKVDADETQLRISIVVGIGGFVETILAWRSGTLDITVDQLIASLDVVGRSLAREFLDLDV